MRRIEIARGDVWWVDFGLGHPGEIQKQRPVVIVSNDSSNRFMNRVQVVALTRNVARLYPNEAYVTLNGRQNKAMADQIQTVGKTRLINRAGRLSDSDLWAVEEAIKVQLGL